MCINDNDDQLDDFYDENDTVDDTYCPECDSNLSKNEPHYPGCPDDDSPYAKLMRDGYD